VRDFKTKLGKDGGTVIPTEYRRELGVEPGDELILHLDEEGLGLYTPAQAVARAQSLVRRYVAEKRSLSEELISERCEEAVHELGGPGSPLGHKG
jgi:bifunctional DNA-binding transcriptional regulator/antitoxin component of YhaV-PrlF toxin-antitoxin module